MTNAPSLYPEQAEPVAQAGRGAHGYYRRGPGGSRGGWIMAIGAWPGFRSDMEYKGYVFLQRYGTWVLPGPGAGSTVTDRRGVRFNPGDEPWRFIFQDGGAHEFPLSQIIAYGWHITPPYREVVFPQLEGVKIYDYFCPECETGTFSSTDKQEAVDWLRQHLVSGKDGTHAYRPEDLRALGEEYGIDFFAPRRGRREASGAHTEQVTNPSQMVAGETTFRCNDCGAEFAARSERMRHGKSCPAKQAVAATA